MKKLLLIITVFIAGCEKKEISKNDIISSEKILGIEFSSSERDSLINTVARRLGQYKALREIDIPNNISFPLFYDPLPIGMKISQGKDNFQFRDIKTLRPDNLEKCAFMTIPQLAYLIRTKQVSSEELTRMYLDRLKRYQNDLQCVVTLTEELAIEQARKADLEISNGKYLGLLHGIPWGAKDLLSVLIIRRLGEPYLLKIKL